ncbi:LuxR C-terminal-related transcriptional regulator [Streptomyces sp. NPDC059944]|uniref:LuxR C-terminal-related transcriptional regulator n=2 Tax=Streptomyces TaxID=1883 RepID=UPI00365C9DE0
MPATTRLPTTPRALLSRHRTDYGPFTVPGTPTTAAADAHRAPHRIPLWCLAGTARGLDDEEIARTLRLHMIDVRAAMTSLEDLAGVQSRSARPALVAYGYRTGLLADLAPEPARQLGAWLTPRRLAVLLLMAQGRTDQQIAESLGCSRKTAANTLAFLVGAFAARNRAHLVAVAYQQQLIDQPLMPLPQHRPTRPFTPQEAAVVDDLAAGQTTQQIRARNSMSVRAAARLLAGAAEAAGVTPRRGLAAVIDSAHRGGLLTVAPEPPDDRPLLAERQHQVLMGVANGFTDAEIARRLHIAYDTVKTALRHLYDALGAGTRAQAVRRGWEFHLLDTPAQ